MAIDTRETTGGSDENIIRWKAHETGGEQRSGRKIWGRYIEVDTKRIEIERTYIEGYRWSV